MPGIGNPQALNRFSYVLNNPVNYVDPTGHDPWWLQEEFSGGKYELKTGTSSGNQARVASYYAPASSAPAPAAIIPQTIGYASGVYQSAYEPVSPTWEIQMNQNVWNMAANPLQLPYYSAQYSSNGGKAAQANALANNNPNPSAPTACIGMSAGADSCLLYAINRLDQGLDTSHVVLIGGTFSSEVRPQFSDWEVDLKRLLDDGTKVLIVNDASIYTDGQQPYETFTYPGYTLGGVPYSDGGYSVLPHHTSTCGTCTTGANNSFALSNSVYTWISKGIWSWNP